MVKKTLIICEGGEDKGFLRKFCKYLNITNIEIEIESMGGKSNLLNKNKYKNVKQKVDAGLYDKVLFVFDSDFIKNDANCGGYENSEKCIKTLIESLDFINIAKYYIMCDPDTTDGNLEHLVLSTIEHEKTICITTLLECINSMKTYDNKKIVLSSYENIFKESPYNLDHKFFDKLKDLLNWAV
jgi:hypothetical protein